MQIELINVSTVKASERSSRIHSEKQISKISKSIKDFGFNNPVLIDKENMIVAGHARLSTMLAG